MNYVFLTVIAAIGLFASIACNVMGWLQIEPPGGKSVYILHIGIFAVWIPLIILTNRSMPKTRRNNFDHVLAELPKWARVAMGIIVAYAVMNFVYFIYSTHKYPKHGVPPYVELRGISGHWMMFYGMALSGFVGLARLDRKRRSTQAALEGREIESHDDPLG